MHQLFETNNIQVEIARMRMFMRAHNRTHEYTRIGDTNKVTLYVTLHSEYMIFRLRRNVCIVYDRRVEGKNVFQATSMKHAFSMIAQHESASA